MNWIDLLKTLGLTTIISGLIVWVIQELGKFFLNKRFKVYEQEIQFKTELFKNEIAKSFDEHKRNLDLLYLKASKSHEKKLEFISILYEKLVELDDAMKVMTAQIKMVTGNDEIDTEEEKKRVENAIKFYNSFIEFYHKRKIFFDKSTVNLIETLRDDYYDSMWDYTYQHRFNFPNSNVKFELAKKASEKVRTIIPAVLNKVENDFREIIGTNISEIKL